ncbi:MAG TPA: methyltransferase domain-containing protein [Acidimicrobiia bacterium]|nr:methyltransferase domain-containing protein [Acidimicrobiia bacterium]
MSSEIVNVDQADRWDGPEGEMWATHQERFDTSILPHHRQLMAAAGIAAGERILDIGCGNGITTRDAARACSPGGGVTAVDLSGPMLARAIQTAKDEGLDNITFQQADAQVHSFEPGAFDLVISRFGVMFFADPVAAFTNIASAVRPGGRLAMLIWQPAAENEWFSALRDVLAMGRDLPLPPAGVPGPFGLADQGHATTVLTAAGFTDVAFADSVHPFNIGADVEGAYRFTAGLAPVKMLTADLDDAGRAEGLEKLRSVIADHETADGVVFGSAAWVMTARRP